jgi:hypothetical protein
MNFRDVGLDEPCCAPLPPGLRRFDSAAIGGVRLADPSLAGSGGQMAVQAMPDHFIELEIELPPKRPQ